MGGGRRLIRISGFLIWSKKKKNLMELIFNSCGEFRWSSEGPVSQIHSPYLYVGAPGIFSDLLRSAQMLEREREREWSAESNGKLPYLFILSKTATLVPEFPVEDLPLDRTATVPAFVVTWWYQSIISTIVFCPREGLSLQTQHSPLYPLLSLPFRIFIQSIYHNVVYHLISSCASNFLRVQHSF